MTYLGKRVEVKIAQRGDNMKLNGKFTTCVGICDSEPGRNEYLDIPLQIVIDRMPISITSLNDIKIL